MKQFLSIVGVIIVFAALEALLESWLGITYPSVGAAIVYKLLVMINGVALVYVTRSKS